MFPCWKDFRWLHLITQSLFHFLSLLGIWSDCPDKAPAVCLQQLLHDPRPEVYPVVPEAAASNRGGEVGLVCLSPVREELGFWQDDWGSQDLVGSSLQWLLGSCSRVLGPWFSEGSWMDRTSEWAFKSYPATHLWKLERPFILPQLQDACL